MKKILTFLLTALLAFGVGWAETVTLSNANIVSAGDANTGYSSWTMTDGNGNTWGAYAIKNQHSNATSGYHFLQIKKYGSNTAYYIQVPELGTKITQIVMTVSSASQPMTGGGNTATLYFSSSSSTSATGNGVASGTGASSVTIDCSSLNLNTGYITASAGVRIWDVTVTYEAGSTPAPEKWYRKVTSANDLVVGNKYIFMKEDGQSSVGMGAITNSYGTPVTGLAISDNRVNIGGTGVVEFTLGGSSDAWNFKNPDDRYLGVASESGDGFVTSGTLGGYTDLRWTVTSTGTVRNNRYTSKYIRCNSANSFGLYSSGTYAYLYVEDLEDCEAPTFSPDGGIFTGSVNVTITSDTEGATIYYTTDGTDPVVGGSNIANGSTIELTESCTLKAMAVKSGMDNSPIVTSQSYTIYPAGGGGSGPFTLVTDASTLEPSDEIIFVSSADVGSSADAMSTTQNNNNRGVTAVDVVAGPKVIATSTTQIFTLQGSSAGWYFYTGSGYIYAQSSSSNNLRTEEIADDNAKATISISNDGEATIVFQGDKTHNNLRYNVNNDNPIYSCYLSSSGLPKPFIYRRSGVPSAEPLLYAEPNPLNINDTNEADGKTGTIYVSGENLGNDNVGVTNYDSNHSTNFSSNPGYFGHNGTVSNYPIAITYTGHALSATGIVYPANNLVSTSVNINYLYTGPIYVVGHVNNTWWNTNDGAQMTRDENGVYSVTVSIQNADGQDAGYIALTKQLGSNYTAGQFGPISDGNWWYNDGLNDIYQPIDTLGNKNNIRILPGTYTITVNPATNEFKIKRYVIDVTISPEDGTHFTGPTISGTITDSPAGTLEWSTDGTNWQAYNDGFTATVDQVGGSVTVYARSTSYGVTSDVVTATYTRDLAPAPEAPSFNIGSSTVAAGTVITITAPAGCTLYVNGQQVTSPYDVVIDHGTTISAYCVNDEGTPSTTVTNTYTIATVCNAIIEFKDNDSDATAATTWNAIGGEEENDYFIAGKDFIDGAVDILRVYKSTTGLKFGNSSYGGIITFNLDSQTEWKVSHITLNAKNYRSNEAVTFTVTTSDGQSETTSEIGSSLGGYTLDFNSSAAITSITISTSARAYLKGFTITYDCVPEIESATLAEIVASTDLKLVKVSDPLIGAWAVVNPQTGAKLLWAKDQGNASIDKRPAKTAGQEDYVKDILKYKRILDEEVQQNWDESNWVILDFSGIDDDPFDFVGHRISANSVKGEYSNDVNYTITLTDSPDLFNKNPLVMDVPEYEGYNGPFPESKLGKDYDLAYNTYVPANFMTDNHNDDSSGKVVGFVADDGALPGCQGDSLYFVNPKIQEVAHIWAVWNGGNEDIFTVYQTEHKENENINAWHLNGTFRVDWTYNCTGVDPNENTVLVYDRPKDLVPNMAYEFHAVIMKPTNGTRRNVAPQGTADPGAPSQDYMIYPLDMSDGGTPTAVLELNAMKTVVSVTYYNLMGVESRKPFEGINIMVTRYSDGSIMTQKVLR